MTSKFLKQKNILILILIILLIGVIQKIYVTSGGNFLFNMDNARDLVDVREMIELKKLRLTGPTSAIEGFYNGPGWYMLLAIPYIIFQGDPYGAILLMIALWAIGGFFLLKLVSRFGTVITFVIGLVWTASNYINLATVYSFNPNPVTLLAPLFIYLLEKYLLQKQLKYLIGASFLGGLFFNFEMNFGIFIPSIILVSLIFTGNLNQLKTIRFWIGVMPFGLWLLPQIIFDLKHKYIMSKSILKFLADDANKNSSGIFKRVNEIINSFYSVSSATFFNDKYLPKIIFLGSIIAAVILIVKKSRSINPLVVISLSVILVPLISYAVVLPVQVNAWHLGAEMTGLIILFGYILRLLMDFHTAGKIAVLLTITFTVFLSGNTVISFIEGKKIPSSDPSLYKNEVTAVDYVYEKAERKNFKAYVYLPSVIDYPYQYIFWWHGLKKYGYTPEDYAYAPSKPPYISNKEVFVSPKKEATSSGLVFLIKEPDRINIRHLWENIFAKLEVIEKVKLRGIEVVTLKDGEFVIF